MKSFLDITDHDLCKIFNTVSHIIYAEMTDETKNTLRRVEYVLTDEEIDLFDRELYHGIAKKSVDDIMKVFVSSYRISLAAMNRKYGIHIIFSTKNKEVDYILDKPVFSSDTAKLYIFVPYEIVDTNLEDEESIDNAYNIIRDIFFNIINVFTDNPNFRGESKRNTAFIANNFGINITNKLSNIFAHMILDTSYEDGEDIIKDSVEYLMESKVERSSQYIKFDISTEKEVLKDVIRTIKAS